MAATLSPEFNTAVKQSKQLTSKPNNDDLLKLYAYYKQALQDPPIEKAETPGVFDLKGKAKKKAWQTVVSEGCTPEEAQTKYVALIEEMKTKYGFDENKDPEEVGGTS